TVIKGAGPAQPASVDAGSAAAEISSYRRARGLSAVSLDSELMGIAKSHSDAMARANKMSHVLWGEGSFQRRLSRGGYNAAIAVENVAAGHRTFAEAFAGWKASRGHNANLLKPGVTQMGIAVAFTPKSNYGNFWTLILAEPDNRQSTLGSEAGPRVAAPG
ncbi:MAG: CAP domain-containing protein, partial [Bauldia sp.]|nr:CAP domain-containing protein [Bauldia sp.]